MVTLGVVDLERSRTFYERLGWQGQTLQETVFFQAGGIIVVLWGRQDLAADAGLDEAESIAGFGGMVLAHNVRSVSEVNAVLEAARAAGGRVSRPAAETFYGGYAGYFQDPDGHLWEIAWNPGFSLTESGAITLPDFAADR